MHNRSIEDVINPQVKRVKHSFSNKNILKQAIITCIILIFYYSLSILLTFLNQRIFHKFKFPLSVTSFHMVVKFLLSVLFRIVYRLYTGKSRVALSCATNVKGIALPGIAGSMDIGLSNWGLEFVTITLYTMTKSTTVIFILLFSLLFKLEKMRISLVAVITFITLGLMMFTYNLTAFSLFGFILLLAASFSSGIRWTCTQIAMRKSDLGLENPLDLMYYIQPWMIAVLIPIALYVEGPSIIDFTTSTQNVTSEAIDVLQQNNWLALPDEHNSEYLPIMMTLILMSAVIAFFLEFSEFVLIYSTSCLTLSIAAILKEVCTLTLASVINNESMSTTNVIGLVICLLGIMIHIIMKAVYNDEDESRHNHEKDYQKIQLLTGTTDTSLNSDEEVDVFQR